jgi:hypothetical protein
MEKLKKLKEGGKGAAAQSIPAVGQLMRYLKDRLLTFYRSQVTSKEVTYVLTSRLLAN